MKRQRDSKTTISKGKFKKESEIGVVKTWREVRQEGEMRNVAERRLEEEGNSARGK